MLLALGQPVDARRQHRTAPCAGISKLTRSARPAGSRHDLRALETERLDQRPYTTSSTKKGFPAVRAWIASASPRPMLGSRAEQVARAALATAVVAERRERKLTVARTLASSPRGTRGGSSPATERARFLCDRLDPSARKASLPGSIQCSVLDQEEHGSARAGRAWRQQSGRRRNQSAAAVPSGIGSRGGSLPDRATPRNSKSSGSSSWNSSSSKRSNSSRDLLAARLVIDVLFGDSEDAREASRAAAEAGWSSCRARARAASVHPDSTRPAALSTNSKHRAGSSRRSGLAPRRPPPDHFPWSSARLECGIQALHLAVAAHEAREPAPAIDTSKRVRKPRPFAFAAERR